MNAALGRSDATLKAVPNNFNHVDDNARVHVLALDPRIAGNQSFIVSNTGMDGMTMEDTNKIVAKRFPEAIEDGRLPNNASYGTVVSKIDNSKTEKTLDFKHASYEETVVSVVGHYLEVLGKEGIDHPPT